MLKRFLVISILLILSIGLVSATDDNITEYNLSDCLNNQNTSPDTSYSLSKSENNTFNNLQSLVDNAKDDDTINLDKNYSYNDPDSIDGVIIKKSLTINGNGNTLDGKDNSRIFLIGDNNNEIKIVLKNIVFINGYSEFGGAIKIYHLANKVTLNIDNCTFKNNHALISGGAIDNYDDMDDLNMGSIVYSNIIVSNSKFNNNTGNSGGGAINSQGNSTNIDNCIFKNNIIKDGGGGALQISDSMSAHILNSEFENNHASSEGGAISYLSSQPMIVSKCQFTSNNAKYGGAIWLSCYYTDCQINNSVFKSNKARKSGGAISFNYHANLINNTFKDNNLPELEIQYSNNANIKYNSGKAFQVKIINPLNNQPISGIKVALYVKISTDGKKYKTKIISSITGKDGIARFKSISKLSNYYYYATFKFQDSFTFVNGTKEFGSFNDPQSLNDDGDIVFKIDKASTKIKAPKITAKFKKTKYFKVKLTSSKKPVKNIKIKLKIYSGKKYKNYAVKTNKKGIAKFNTKKLYKGTHKVLIQSGNSRLNYKITGKSKIIIK